MRFWKSELSLSKISSTVCNLVVGVKEAERIKIRGREARLIHVEVFQMESVGTLIFRETSTSTQAATRTGPHHHALHPQLRRAL